nr:hypothetical protein [Tanacetum cinerariifolium]
MLHVLRVEMVINSPWMLSKNWLVQKQTPFGKDISNPFMDDNLPKIVWFLTHHITCMKKLASPKANGYWNVCVEIGINAARLSKLLLSGKCDVTRLKALVDKKKIVISVAVIHEILQLNDAEGMAFFSSQWKFLIHTILQSLSAKRTSWNEFSTSMASAVICLSKGHRFNFSKYIFDSLVRNVDSSSKFYMGRDTFFESMLVVRDVAEEAEAQVPAQRDNVQESATEEVVPDIVPPTLTPPSPLSPVIPSLPPHQPPCLENDKAAQQLEIVKLKARVKKLEKINKDEGIEQVADQEKDAEFKGRHADKQAEIYNIDLDHSSKVLSMQEDDTEVQEAVEIVTTAKLMTEPKILTITATPAVSTQRRKGVVIRDPEEELPFDTPAKTPKLKDKGKRILIESPKPMKKKDQIEIDAEYARKLQEEINKEHEESYKNIDWNAALNHVQFKEPQYIKRYHGMKKKPQTESEARKNMIFYLKNTEGYKMDFFKGKMYDEILLIFQAKFDANMMFLFKSREEMEAEDEEIIKSINETPA